MTAEYPNFDSERSIHEHIIEFDKHRGSILGVWAGLEGAIDQANHYAWHYSRKSVSKVVPQSLRWKLKLFEAIHTKLIPLEPLREAAEVLVVGIKHRLDDRHWLAHGCILPRRCDPESWTLQKNEFLKDGSLALLHRRFTPNELTEISLDVARLAIKVSSYGDALLTQICEHPIDNQG